MEKSLDSAVNATTRLCTLYHTHPRARVIQKTSHAIKDNATTGDTGKQKTHKKRQDGDNPHMPLTEPKHNPLRPLTPKTKKNEHVKTHTN